MANAKNTAVTSGTDLPDRIIQLVTNAPYASFVVRRASDRIQFLPEIISLHTRRELSEIAGLGRSSIARIQAWLAQHGRRLRMPNESIDTVICHFGVRPKNFRRHRRPNASAVISQFDPRRAKPPDRRTATSSRLAGERLPHHRQPVERGLR
jgi:hypothetical protein